MRSGSEPTGPHPEVVLSGVAVLGCSAAALGSGVAVLDAAAQTEENDTRTLEGVRLLPGITDFLLPHAVPGPSPDSGLMPIKLVDLLRQTPLSQSEINSGRMEMAFACGLAGVVRLQFWRPKAGADACRRSRPGGSRVLETSVSEQKRQQRRKELQRHARESLKRIKADLIRGHSC